MLKKFFNRFIWDTVKDTGLNRYQINRGTGKRRVISHSMGGWQPIDQVWVDTGEWRVPHPPAH